MQELEPKECLDFDDIERHLQQDSWVKSDKAPLRKDAELYSKKDVNAAEVEDLLEAAFKALRQLLSKYVLVDDSKPTPGIFSRVHNKPKQKPDAARYWLSSHHKRTILKHRLSCNKPQQLFPFETSKHSSAKPEIENEFCKLVEVWRKDVAFTSSIEKMAMHPNYQRIIGMGPAVVPLILRDLEKESDHWFWALHSITGADPVDPKDAGDIDKMAHAWIEWGRREGLI